MISETADINLSEDSRCGAVLEKYLALVALIDSHAEKTASALKNEIVCGPGCSDCCILSSAAAVEAHIIIKYTRRHGIKAAGKTGCPFLENDLCLIYPVRPVICRTHGLPVMTAGEVHSCEKNFSGECETGPEYILDLDTVNNHTAAINLAWVKISGSCGADEDGRIPLIHCGCE